MRASLAARLRGVARSSGEHLDLVVACGMAFAVASVSMLDVFGGDESINEAILLVLGFYSLAIFRDRRSRQRATEAASALRCLDDTAAARLVAEDGERSAYWSHRGGAGETLRQRLLPRLRALSARGGGSFVLQVELADPLDAALCEAHAGLRRTGGDREWTAAEVRDDILLTVMVLCYLCLRTPVQVRLAVSGALRTVAVDVSGRAVLLDPMAPGAQALAVDASLSHARGHQQDLAATFAFARELPLAAAGRRIASPDVVDIDEMNGALVDLAVLPDDYRRADLSRLAAAVTAALPAPGRR